MKHETSHQTAAETLTLLARHQAGDASALNTLIERYYERIRRMVCVRLGADLLARETIDDVLQDVLVRVVESAARFEARGDAKWINLVALQVQHEISNHARRARTKKRGGDVARVIAQAAASASGWDPPAETTGVHSKVARAELMEIVDACLGELSEAHREVILLRDYAGGDWATVAEAMERTSAACQELYRRGIRDLRARINARL